MIQNLNGKNTPSEMYKYMYGKLQNNPHPNFWLSYGC